MELQSAECKVGRLSKKKKRPGPKLERPNEMNTGSNQSEHSAYIRDFYC